MRDLRSIPLAPSIEQLNVLTYRYKACSMYSDLVVKTSQGRWPGRLMPFWELLGITLAAVTDSVARIRQKWGRLSRTVVRYLQLP